MQPQRRSHNWWKYLLTFLGGMIFALGGTALGIYIYGSNTKLKSFFGADVDLYLTPEYQNKSLFDVIAGLINGEFNFKTLEDVSKVTPYVNSQLETINETLKENFGYTFNIDEMSKIPFSELEDYISDELHNKITLAGVLGVNEDSSKLLRYLCFHMNDDGTFNYDYPYAMADYMDGGDEFFTGLVNNMKIDYAIDNIDEDNYILLAIKDFTISDLQDAEKINSIEIGSFFSPEQIAGSTLLESIQHWPIGDLGSDTRLNQLTIKDVFDISEEDKGSVLYAIRNKTIQELKDSTGIDDIIIGDLIKVDEDASSVMKYLEDKTIGDLKDDDLVNKMDLKDITDVNASDFLKAISELEHYFVLPANAEEHPSGVASSPRVLQIFDSAQEFDVHDGSELSKPFLSADAVALMNELDDGQFDGDYYLYGKLSGTRYDSNTNTWSGFLDHKIKIENFTNNSGQSVQPEDGKFDDKIVIVHGCFQRTHGTKVGQISDSINLLTLADVIDCSGDNPILNALKDNSISELPDAISNLRIDQVFTYSDFDSLPPVLKTLITNQTKVTELESAINDLTLKDVLNIDENDKLWKLRDCVLDATDIWDRIESEYTLGDIIDIDENSTKILRTLQNTPIASIGDTISTLKLNQMVDIDENSPKILQYLQEKTLDELNSADIMNEMTLSDVLTEDQINASKFLKLVPADTNITQIGQAVENLKIVDVFEDQIYKKNPDDSINYLAINDIWRYLLLEPGETLNTTSTTNILEGLKCVGDGTDLNPGYRLGSDITKLTDNMSNNIASARLQDLYDHGIISLNASDVGFLTRTIILPPTNPYYAEWNGRKYGELTIQMFIQIINSLV